MVVTSFPDVSEADDSGILAMGGNLKVESLLDSYRNGIFPWPIAGDNLLLWFAPPKRAVLFFKDFHVSRRLRKTIKQGRYKFEINTSFEKVIRACASSNNRQGQKGTWILPEIISAYIDFFHAGFCHSIECYHNGKSVGGLYGVAIGKMFAGESMFHTESDGSKVSLCFLVDYLRKKGVEWIDCQQMTPLLASFGAKEIDRQVFMKMLKEAVNQDVRLF
jgi:leucyl/phenylalanyl-tRNA---protein transferase